MTLEEVRPILATVGFVEQPTSFPGLGTSFRTPVFGDGKWMLSAYASGDQYVDINLVRKSGADGGGVATQHRVLSTAALQMHLPEIVRQLVAMSADEARMKCPKCNRRWVVVKERTRDHHPFLSCEGMIMTGRGRNKHVECDGISNLLPARLEYR